MPWQSLVGERPTSSDLLLMDSVLTTQVIGVLRSCNAEEFDKVFGQSLTWTLSRSDGTVVGAFGDGPWDPAAPAPVLYQDRLAFAEWVEEARLHEAWRQLRAVRQGLSEVRVGGGRGAGVCFCAWKKGVDAGAHPSPHSPNPSVLCLICSAVSAGCLHRP
jgi:hypothetical protein